MTIARNIKIVFFLLMFPFCCAIAQEEYTWELGGAIGGSFYMGDANSSTLFKNTGIAGGFIARYLLNPHMAGFPATREISKMRIPMKSMPPSNGLYSI